MLPNLLIIGAAKAGTTSLHRYLDAHPQVYMSSPKELNFWQDPDCLNRLPAYEQAFSDERAVGATIRGEATVLYTFDPLFQGTAERIASVISHARLIYIVRDPVDRAISHYLQDYAGHFTFPRSLPYYSDHLSDLDREPTLEDAFADVENPLNPYVLASRFGTQLDRYLEHFPRERLLVLDHSDLLERRAATLAQVHEFLGVEPVEPPELEERLNTTEGKRRAAPAYSTLLETKPMKFARATLPEAALYPIRWAARALFTEKLASPPVGDALRNRLYAVLTGEIDRLEQITGRSFAHWRA